MTSTCIYLHASVTVICYFLLELCTFLLELVRAKYEKNCVYGVLCTVEAGIGADE